MKGLRVNLLKAMFQPSLLWSMFKTMIGLGGFILIYSVVAKIFGAYIFTEVFSSNSNIEDAMLLLLYLIISYYVMIVIVPSYIFIKPVFNSSIYLAYVAKVYGVKLHPMRVRLRKKYYRRASLNIFLSFIFTLIIWVLSMHYHTMFVVLIAFIPFYIILYKNWIRGLRLAFGTRFKEHYEKNKKRYMQRAAFLILLQHIPIFWFLQPWMIQIMSIPYVESEVLHLNVKCS